MTEQLWTPGDVYFGSADAPPVNWREEASPSDEDDDVPLSDAERRAVVSMLGFDPNEISTEDVS